MDIEDSVRRYQKPEENLAGWGKSILLKGLLNLLNLLSKRKDLPDIQRLQAYNR